MLSKHVQSCPVLKSNKATNRDNTDNTAFTARQISFAAVAANRYSNLWCTIWIDCLVGGSVGGRLDILP